MLKFNVITIFPNVFATYCGESILKRAQEKKLVQINVYNLRDYTQDKHHSTDDTPYGGGPGMVMMVEPIANCLEKLRLKRNQKNTKIILLSARGQKFDQKMARDLALFKNLTLICGRYEGVDQRVSDYLIDQEISIGDYVLTGGELPVMVMIDAITRLVPGVIKPESLNEESFSLTDDTAKTTGADNVLEYPQYTKPEDFKGWKVPEVLLSGDHKKIKQWKEAHIRNF